ncbi:MAG: hypothetical protein JNK84_05540 [Phreatobacter sp.]|uniref:ribbon-helix-helix domain-containing protein n=1 Tax=Phreatobacter sp. TaxID=1966341 RepID=UPI001A486CDB|nr:ribbon-helix-helix domain-containing protein [Phreatobacter sp.]MBL8568530.1 hypothetical protein [Phreatobacter sp.]
MTMISLQLPPDLLAAVDRFIEEDSPAVSRNDAMLAALRAWAVGNGLMLSWRGPAEPPATWPQAANDG